MTKRILLILPFFGNFLSDTFTCPKDNGQFEDPKQCDKFYECEEGVVYERLCPDGLVFDPTNRKVNKCDHLFNVDCGDRLELRKSQQENKTDSFKRQIKCTMSKFHFFPLLV